jgi:hypothetical protein
MVNGIDRAAPASLKGFAMMSIRVIVIAAATLSMASFVLGQSGAPAQPAKPAASPAAGRGGPDKT